MSVRHVFVPINAKLGEGFSIQEIAKAGEHPGRRTKTNGYQSPATWVLELVSLRKPVILCSFCRYKFDPKYYKYRRFYVANAAGHDPYRTDGQCEDCKDRTDRSPGGGTMFVAEEQYPEICFEPKSLPGWNDYIQWRLRQAKQRVYRAAATTWRAVQRS